MKKKMKEEMEVYEPHVAEAYEATRAGFEYVAKHVGPTR